MSADELFAPNLFPHPMTMALQLFSSTQYDLKCKFTGVFRLAKCQARRLCSVTFISLLTIFFSNHETDSVCVQGRVPCRSTLLATSSHYCDAVMISLISLTVVGSGSLTKKYSNNSKYNINCYDAIFNS